MENVAAEGHTVLFSSHLVSDLERVCDYLIILAASHVQVADEVEHLLESHKRLTGPHDHVGSIAHKHRVIQTKKAERHTTLLVRLNGPMLDPAWIVEDITLEDIVLGYLAQPTHDTEFTETRMEA
jgi:ABC-2 type transport system ATP-binding protein